MRNDDFAGRRGHLVHLSDEELAQRFWQLAEQVVTPLLEMAELHTSPSIERSVLMRMGFNSLEAKSIVEKCLEQGLLGKGAGHVVWRLAAGENISIEAAGRMLLEGSGWERVKSYFAGGDACDVVSR